MEYDRTIVGGGLFGAYSALILARRGYSVLLIERDPELMQRATLVNQARLHSGLHYPRSFLTAMESKRHYDAFKAAFPDVVREDFTKVYAVPHHQSKTSPSAFLRFVERLGQVVSVEDPARWFAPGTVALAVRVNEGSFDAEALLKSVLNQIRQLPNITVRTSTTIVSGEASESEVSLRTSSGEVVSSAGVVLATYAGLNPIRRALGLSPLPLKHELTEVVLCRVGDPYRDLGITLMDGPFWSFMPFGWSPLVSVTSVSLTPVMSQVGDPAFPCQSAPALLCSPEGLQRCTECAGRPASLWGHHRQQLARYLRSPEAFTYERSMWTVKTILASAEVDDARPTFVRREQRQPIWTVFSGKVSTVLDLEGELE